VLTVLSPGAYDEQVDVLFDCLGSLLLQTNRDRLVVVMAFEAKTPDLQQKMDTVRAAFETTFGDLLIVAHVLNPRLEIAGAF
jgi:hypothetical protein